MYLTEGDDWIIQPTCLNNLIKVQTGSSFLPSHSHSPFKRFCERRRRRRGHPTFSSPEPDSASTTSSSLHTLLLQPTKKTCPPSEWPFSQLPLPSALYQLPSREELSTLEESYSPARRLPLVCNKQPSSTHLKNVHTGKHKTSTSTFEY